MTQHASLSPERWAAFSRDQQILMIGNEMNRATRLLRLGDRRGGTLKKCGNELKAA
ncbi:MAG TPA: hypothetical protein VIA62_19195 [Thermoanaerobaculia bacterium]|jgi:hypothetical protein|nr:hypothetical protein [Thermoanaerobaculia bacterium]